MRCSGLLRQWDNSAAQLAVADWPSVARGSVSNVVELHDAVENETWTFADDSSGER